MIPISSDARAAMVGSRPFIYSISVTFTSGTTITLTEDDLCATGCKIITSPGTSSMPIGNAISRCLQLSFFNANDRFANYSFYGATVHVTVSIILEDSTEPLDLGTFTITEPETYGTNISIVGYDNFYLADKEYKTQKVFPASAQSVFVDVCDKCGLIPYSSAFKNNSYVIQHKPEGLSCRQVIGLISMIAGGNAVVDGRNVKIISYDIDAMDYLDPSAAPTTFHKLDVQYSQTISTDDVVITGFSVKTEGEPVTVGTSGYVIEVENVLLKDNELSAANLIGDVLIGLHFRPFNMSTPSYPIAEFGDLCVLYNNNHIYKSFITDIEFAFKGATTLKCSADSPLRSTSKTFTSSTKAYQALRTLLRDETTAREAVETELTERLNAATGLYMTTQTSASGDIYYLHDKPDLEDSMIVWKMTTDAVGVSTDGGETWNAGLTVDGNLIAQILTSVGVNADWINTGSLSISDSQGAPVFYADLDTKSVYISGDRVFIGDQSATDALAELSGVLTVSLSNETQGIPVDNNGDYTVFPEVDTEIRVIYGGEDVTDLCSLEYGEFHVSGDITHDDGYYTYTPSDLTADTGYATFTAKYNPGTGMLTGTKRFTLFKAYAGETGPDGAARTYFLEANATVIKQGVDDAFVPGTVTYSAYYRDGTSAERSPYVGLIKIEATKDGTNWETVVDPLENKSSESYTPTDPETAFIRCTLYSLADIRDIYHGLWIEGSSTVLADDDGSMLEIDHTIDIIDGGHQVDIQTTAVVRDVSALTQDNIFDILTNNRQTQGLYLYNGKVYLNAEYMATGVLVSRNTAANAPQIRWDLDSGEFTITKNNTRIFHVSTGNNGISIVADNFSLSSGATIDTIAEGKASSALASANNYTDGKATDTLNSANSYTDGKASSTLADANRYADNKSGAAVNSAKDYTDEAASATLRSAQAYARGVGGNFLEDAENYAANQDAILDESFNQLKVYNRLTNNSQNEGIYLSGGRLYINASLIHSGTMLASYIHGGILTLGGKDNINGSLDIKHTNGESLITGDQNGLNVACQSNTASAQAFSSGIYYKSSQSGPIVYSLKTKIVGNQIYLMRKNDVITAGFVSYVQASGTTTMATLLSAEEGALSLSGKTGVQVTSDFSVTSGHTKSKIVDTEDYGKRALYCYEMATPVFGDIGEGVIAEDGYCYIQIDPVFSESINTLQYQVFLQRYGEGDCYVKKRYGTYFIVAGTPGLEFGWEIKAKQADIDQLRLEKDNGSAAHGDEGYAQMALNHIDSINEERNGR